MVSIAIDHCIALPCKGETLVVKSDLEELGLISGEGTSDAKVQFLPGVHRHRFVLIWKTKIVERLHNICLRNGAKLSPIDALEKPKTVTFSFLNALGK